MWGFSIFCDFRFCSWYNINSYGWVVLLVWVLVLDFAGLGLVAFGF